MGRRTLASDLASDVERVFLNPDEFGTEVILIVDATGEEQPLKGLWTEHEAHRDIQVGERGVKTGVLVIASCRTVSIRDQFWIDGIEWQLAPNEWEGADVGGMKTINLRRDIKSNTRKHARGLI